MIKIVDYGLGNPGSIRNMLLKLGGNVSAAQDPVDLAGASLIILPGVGSFDNGMRRLQERGFDHAIREVVRDGNAMFLGICLGMQLLFEGSEEGVEAGLGLIPGRVRRFQFKDPKLKIPHMGWNRVQQFQSNQMLDGVFEDARFYFAHSYHVSCSDEWVLGKTDYGYEFPSVVMKNNIFGAQFHPEKSHRYGLGLLKRFVDFKREQ
jgi:glutamine amidotransferase